MPSMRNLGGVALIALLLAGCQPSQQTSPISLTPGTVEYQLRQQQLQNVQSDPSRAMQNPTVTNVSPGAAGIERAPMGGSGGIGAGAPVTVSPGVGGITRAPGVGAPTR